MSWLFSQALVAEYSAANCSGGEPSAPLSVMPTPHKFWHSGKTMDALSLSRFGLTCAVLTEDRGQDLLTWFLAGFRAKTSAAPARERDSTANALDSGAKWPGSLARFDRDSFSWRTRQCSLFEDSEPCLETWPRWGLMHGGECWELDREAPGSLYPTEEGTGDGTLSIGTLEGQHLVSWGDWIIQGVKGELYPCKPDIFDATYEAA